MLDTTDRLEGTKTEIYEELARQLGGLFYGERDATANAANMAALIGRGLPDLNWAGFYIMRGDELVLGPFWGKPACVRIELGKGVCGTAAVYKESIIVTDVHEFPGHIVCDAASQSELVVPIIRNGVVIGVLDLDSPSLARFDAEDQAACENLVRLFVAASEPF
ncbi:Free methionine-R-sulfoxide reductase [Alphaproteobacteria bacterium SO-S41]|nr:Free methionine-R-sulfoxide reductase [Alphaproteobacteria bacterium SO-S41]